MQRCPCCGGALIQHSYHEKVYMVCSRCSREITVSKFAMSFLRTEPEPLL